MAFCTENRSGRSSISPASWHAISGPSRQWKTRCIKYSTNLHYLVYSEQMKMPSMLFRSLPPTSAGEMNTSLEVAAPSSKHRRLVRKIHSTYILRNLTLARKMVVGHFCVYGTSSDPAVIQAMAKGLRELHSRALPQAAVQRAHVTLRPRK